MRVLVKEHNVLQAIDAHTVSVLEASDAPPNLMAASNFDPEIHEGFLAVIGAEGTAIPITDVERAAQILRRMVADNAAGDFTQVCT